MQELLTQVAGLEGLRQALIVTDLAGTVVRWNRAAEQLCGWSADEVVGLPVEQVVEVEIAPADLVQRLHVDPAWTGDSAVRRRDGTAFLAHVRNSPLRDSMGTLCGLIIVIEDVTDRRWSEQLARDHGERAQQALAAATVGAWRADVTTGLTAWDDTMEQLFGLPPGSFTGIRADWVGRLHADDRETVLHALRRAVSEAETVDIEHRVVRADGTVRWLHTIGQAVTAADGSATGVTGVSIDVTERRRGDEERAAFLASERARRDRVSFLAEASAALAESLDDEQTLTMVGELVVGRLADWFAVDLRSDGRINTVAVGHVDAGKQQRLTALQARSSTDHGAVADVASVLRTGQGRLHAAVDEAAIALPDDAEHLELLRAVGARSVIVAPLTARGRTFGALTLVLADSDVRYTADDLTLAGNLARRAALAIDNARLFADRAEVARVLQQSLLPPQMPDVPGIDIAARYRAAQVGSDIGGDFYDLFPTLQDRWAIVIGDVSGKGTDAAVLTGNARHTLRAAAVRQPGPAAVLAELNQAILAQEHGERFLTVAYACMRVHADRAELIVASAGHPAPLVLRADGRLDIVESDGGLLGLFDEADLSETAIELAPGDALVLHTDGVLEARGQDGFFDEHRLHALLRSCAGQSAAEIAASIDDTVLAFQDGHPRDDVAVLVVRVPPSSSPDPTP